MDRLRKIYLEPTTACNLNCRMCIRQVWDEPEGFMSWEVFEAALGGLRAAGVERDGTVAFMGLGEPLLHPDFLDMVRTVKGRGLRAEVTTNALLLTGEIAEGLREARLDQLVVSIDGASAEAFGHGHSAGLLKNVVKNVNELRERATPGYGAGVQVGIEFVVMRSNVTELAALNRIAIDLGASFVLISNVLAYEADVVAQTLYEHGLTAKPWAATPIAPQWRMPSLDWDEHIGSEIGRALSGAGSVCFSAQESPGPTELCPFVDAGACAVAWHGAVSPCPPLLHSYSYFLRSRKKAVTKWEVGRLPEESLQAIWSRSEYADFRRRVRDFDFPPCVDCACELAEENLEDCFGNRHPVCGDCLWARGIVRCP
jgi:MoaA/NifB/PqqE/SkfB family radical SAM enzyme